MRARADRREDSVRCRRRHFEVFSLERGFSIYSYKRNDSQDVSSVWEVPNWRDYFDWYDADCDPALTRNLYLCPIVGRV